MSFYQNEYIKKLTQIKQTKKNQCVIKDLTSLCNKKNEKKGNAKCLNYYSNIKNLFKPEVPLLIIKVKVLN